MNILFQLIRRLIPPGLVLLLALLPLQSASAQTEGAQIRITQVDNSKFPQVTMYVSVTDASGEPLGVDPSQVQIFENGTLIQADQVSGSGEIGPLTTLLVVDVSGSMYNAGKLTAAQAAAAAYIDQMRSGDQAGLLTFNTSVTYLQPVTSDREALKRAIDSLKPKGNTALYDALIRATKIMQAIAGRKAIIALTDGLDNVSKQTADEVIQSIGTGGLSISTIGLGDPTQVDDNSGLDEATLRSLAARAGGIYGYANEAGTLKALYELLGRALQSEYRITYTSPLSLRDGLTRTLSVSLSGTVMAQAHYNPGGVLPEVSRTAPWTIFGAMLAGLLILLVVPLIISRLKNSRFTGAVLHRKASHIRLK